MSEEHEREHEDKCGCEWVLQHPKYGDVLVRPCADHMMQPPDDKCGCRVELDADLGVNVAVQQCKRHAALSTFREMRTSQGADYELDQLVAGANRAATARGQKMAPRIWGPDK